MLPSSSASTVAGRQRPSGVKMDVMPAFVAQTPIPTAAALASIQKQPLPWRVLGADFAERTWDWGALPRPFSLGRTLDGHPPVKKAFDVMLLPVGAQSLTTSSALPTLFLTHLTAAWQKGPPHGPPDGDLTSGGSHRL